MTSRTGFLRSIPRGEGVDDYVPRDEHERAETYHRWSGQWSQWWPVPLTPCTTPATRKD